MRATHDPWERRLHDERPPVGLLGRLGVLPDAVAQGLGQDRELGRQQVHVALLADLHDVRQIVEDPAREGEQPISAS